MVQNRTPFAWLEVSGTAKTDLKLVWGHGWGQSSAAFISLAETLKPFASSFVIDFPGFGQSPPPPSTWGTADFADSVAEWLKMLAPGRNIWVGHSFGGRVGIQLAARHPDLLAGMVLIAGAGLQRRRTLLERIRLGVRRTIFRAGKKILGEGPKLDRLRQRLGSADYRSAGQLRPILNRVVNEDLTQVAERVQCPTLLIYGRADSETPPEIGERLRAVIPKSELVLLDGFGHLDILTEGRHQVLLRIRKFLDQIIR
jgi:pimeloyl-ACP methyl ester carboxylesterase